MLQKRSLVRASSLVAVLMPASAAVGEEVADIGASYSTTIEINGEIDEYECCTPVRFTDESSPEGGVGIYVLPAWDEQYLYFLTMMEDTYLNARVESVDDAGALKDDCFQIFLDPDYSRDAVMQDDDYRIAVTVWDYVLDGSGWDNWERDAGLTHALTRIATVNDNDDVDQGGSFIELGIPWSVLGVEPEQGTELGILFGTTDLDPEGTPYTANHLGLEDPNRPKAGRDSYWKEARCPWAPIVARHPGGRYEAADSTARC